MRENSLSQSGKRHPTSTVLAATINMITLNAAVVSGLYLPLTIQPGLAASNAAQAKAQPAQGNSGTLIAMAASGATIGQCPLEHTDVTCQISGYVSRVKVTQIFKNPYKQKIEATYTFPLSENGAVDDMVMKVGKRTIRGTIKKREQAKQIYDQARAAGHVAALLDQQRTNIFTQSVANIEPGESVEITLQYVELLKYDAGKFTFTFPTVVGPRFIPGSASGQKGTGWAADTDLVPDASQITPPVTPSGTRAGHDISINVVIDAGVPLQNIDSKLHDVNIQKSGPDGAVVSLKDKQTIPNKDFVLSWDVASTQLKSGYLTHKDASGKSGFFTLMLLPPKRVTAENVSGKEMIFLIDCSGSQNGAPLEKAKETLSYIVDHMNAQDTFQIIAFSNGQTILFDKPKPVTKEMKATAQTFIDHLQANGGTWMGPAIEATIAIAADDHRLRIVTFMTDGYVGNDMEILSMIHKHRETSRWFSFGTGNSVNRFLIDGMAKEGGGEADYVLLNSSAAEVGKKFYDRISSPVLTDVCLDFGKLQVKEVYPKEISDVWAERPLYFKGRYLTPGKGTITLTGFAAGKPYKQTLDVDFPAANSKNEVLSSIWARAKVDRLMSEDWAAAQTNNINKELKEEIVKTALQYHIMTNYTSFVAVEEKTVTKGGTATQVTVPVEMPEGVSQEHVFGGNLRSRIGPIGQSQAKSGSMARSYAYGGTNVSNGYQLQGATNGTIGMHGYAAAAASPAPNMSFGAFGGSTLAVAPNVPRPEGKKAMLDLEKSKVTEQTDSKHISKLDAKLESLMSSPLEHQSAVKGFDAKKQTVEVSIELADTSDATFERLKKTKLLQKIERKDSKVIATVRLADLKKLANLTFVKVIQSLP